MFTYHKKMEQKKTEGQKRRIDFILAIYTSTENYVLHTGTLTIEYFTIHMFYY